MHGSNRFASGRRSDRLRSDYDHRGYRRTGMAADCPRPSHASGEEAGLAGFAAELPAKYSDVVGEKMWREERENREDRVGILDSPVQ